MTSIDRIKQKLDEYVNNGGNVEDLIGGDALYKYIKDAKVYEDERTLTLEEKFAAAGYPRTPKRAYNAEEALKERIEEYLENGGSFHVARKQLPFYEILRGVLRTKKNKYGYEISSENYMKSLGYVNYSDQYYRFSRILEIENYKNDEGYVDSYRKDPEFHSYIDSCAATLGVPIAVIVGLIGNQNLKKYSLDVDFFKETKEELEDYIQQNGGLYNIKKNNLRLYDRICLIKKRMATMEVGQLTNKDVLNMLDIDDNNNSFKDRADISEYNIEKIMFDLKNISDKQEGKIYKKDISDEDYFKILGTSLKCGCYMKSIFHLYDMDYVDGRSNKRFKKMIVDGYPYLKEMREMRDEIYSQQSNHYKLCEEQKFENYMYACLEAYKKFNSKIHNFDSNNESEVAVYGL